MSTRQLQDGLEHAAQALPDPAMATLAEVRERANSRRRRRWTLTAAASLSAVVLIGVAGVNLLPQGPDSPVIEPVGRASQAVELADDAVWKSPPVADATTAAEVFTELFLGWDDPTIELSTNDETGPVFVTVAAREDEGRQVRALFAPTPAVGVWQVLQVGDGLGTSGPDPRVVNLDPPVPSDAASADLFVRYAGQTWHVTLDGDEVRNGRVDLAAYGLPPGRQRNAGLIVYRDASGKTLTAAGGHSGTGDRPSEPSRDPETKEPPRQIASEVAADGSVAVANGSSFGVEWSLRARHSHGVVCLDLDDGSGGTGTQCTAPVEPSDIRFGSSQAGEQTPVFVVGQVGKKVASVEVILATGEPVEAELVEVGALPVNVYVAVLPPGARPTEVVARNVLGLKVASSS